MTTVYQTPRGQTYEPLAVDLYHYSGTPLGRVGAFESMDFTWAERSADTGKLTTPLNHLTAALQPCDGQVLVAARMNGKTHLSIPVSSSVQSGKTPDTAVLEVTTAGGWTLFDAEVLPPNLEHGGDNSDVLEYTVRGPLEDVVKRLVTIGSARAGHPVYVTPSQHRGPQVVATGAWNTVADALKGIISHTGYRVTVTGWVPGDPTPEGAEGLTTPCVVVDVVPYRDRDGLVWTVQGHDLSDWGVERTRAQLTRLTVGNQAKELQDRYSLTRIGQENGSPWQRRDGFVKVQDPEALGENDVDPHRIHENLELTAEAELAEKAASLAVSSTIAPGGMWEFGADGTYPRQYDIGDYAMIDVPFLGPQQQVITEVEVKLTPAEFTVTPTVSTPDTLDTDIYATVADTSRRVTTLEKR